MNVEYEAAINFIKNCRQTYPEIDLMDDDTKVMYSHCWDIVRSIQQPQPLTPQPKSKKEKKKGKLQQFEEDVIECLRQGWGEERQLLEEAENRRNQWARKNYIRAYYRAVARFNRGRE